MIGSFIERVWRQGGLWGWADRVWRVGVVRGGVSINRAASIGCGVLRGLLRWHVPISNFLKQLAASDTIRSLQVVYHKANSVKSMEPLLSVSNLVMTSSMVASVAAQFKSVMKVSMKNGGGGMRILKKGAGDEREG